MPIFKPLFDAPRRKSLSHYWIYRIRSCVNSTQSTITTYVECSHRLLDPSRSHMLDGATQFLCYVWCREGGGYDNHARASLLLDPITSLPQYFVVVIEHQPFVVCVPHWIAGCVGPRCLASTRQSAYHDASGVWHPGFPRF